MKCIFCLSETNPHTTREHIIPASLGNEDDILDQGVCDKCQNYFAIKVEKPALSDTPFAFWRTFYGIKTKKGKEPFYQVKPSIKSDKIKEKLLHFPTFHPSYHGSKTIELEIFNTTLEKSIISSKINQLRIILSPDKIEAMGRLLSKIALEYFYLQYEECVFDKKFDSLRSYARCGANKSLWPILYCRIKGDIPVYEKNNHDDTESVEIYRYGLYEVKDRDWNFFIFQIGCERWGIYLDAPTLPEEALDMLTDVDGNRFENICY